MSKTPIKDPVDTAIQENWDARTHDEWDGEEWDATTEVASKHDSPFSLDMDHRGKLLQIEVTRGVKKGSPDFASDDDGSGTWSTSNRASMLGGLITAMRTLGWVHRLAHCKEGSDKDKAQAKSILREAADQCDWLAATIRKEIK